MSSPTEYQPWYSDLANEHPYALRRTIKLSKAQDFRGLSPFPWYKDSLSTLWNGSFNSDDTQSDWLRYVSEYWDAVAIGSNDHLHIVFTQSARPPITFKIMPVKQTLLDADRPYVGWTMKMSVPFEPLVLYAYGSILHIFNVSKKGFEGYQRAHGGAITSIAIHPTTPDYFATTSRDHTTRIYDLRLPAVLPLRPGNTHRRKEYNPNPHWLPGKNPSLAGAAHGLRLHPNEIEGIGPGRCVVVLMGGRSGGHNAAVLHAAFHPSFPLIATCGMDRAVKIWPFRPDHPEQIKREDKPFFSSSKIHKARVLSINWLSSTSDVLITHSATAINRRTPKDPQNKAIYLEAGELTVWTWLSLDRFFPPEFEGRGLNTARPISSDYQDSSSFKLISTHAFPSQRDHIISPVLSMFHSPTHDPLITFVYPNAPYFTTLNPAHMKPRQIPEFPYPELNRYPVDDPLEHSVESTRKPASQGGNEAESDDEGQGDQEEDEEDNNAPPPRRPDKGKGKATDTEDAAPDLELSYDEEYVPHDGDEPEVISGTIRRRAEATPPPIQGWRINLPEHTFDGGRRGDGVRRSGGGDSKKLGLMNVCVTGGGRMIIGVGTQGSIWVWRYDS